MYEDITEELEDYIYEIEPYIIKLENLPDNLTAQEIAIFCPLLIDAATAEILTQKLLDKTSDSVDK